MTRRNHRPPRLIAYCAICGARIQRNGLRARWRHQRPRLDGSPHDHYAQPRKDQS